MGDRVVVYPSLSCGACEGCERGEDSHVPPLPNLRRGRRRGFGASSVGFKPVGSSPSPTPSLLPKAPLFPWPTRPRGVASRRRVYTPATACWFLGASGGVGSAAVGLARRVGAYVFAVTSSPEKAEQLRDLGSEPHHRPHTGGFRARRTNPDRRARRRHHHQSRRRRHLGEGRPQPGDRRADGDVRRDGWRQPGGEYPRNLPVSPSDFRRADGGVDETSARFSTCWLEARSRP